MPIRINLLAESLAAEEMRRRDPAKRAGYIAVLLVCAVLIWSASLQMKLVADNVKLGHLQSSLNSRTNEYAQIMADQAKLAEVNDRLDSLHRLTANRFLQANLLNALQRTTVEGITLSHLRLDQGFYIVQSGKGHKGSSTEKDLLTIEAKDNSANPGSETITAFKECLTRLAYFQHEHMTTNDILLKNLSMPQADADTGKPFVMFSFECRFPEKSH
jgi:hypothetical protein